MNRLILRAAACAALVSTALLAMPVRAQDAASPDYAAIVAAPDRSDADRQVDQRRQPARMLAFAGVKPGMTILDMAASAGYSTELLARTVAPSGKVYAQDSAAVLERFVKDRFDTRAKSPAMKNVVHVVRDYDDPIPPDLKNLDMITFFFFYHDITYLPVDRAAMNKKMFAALKPGGTFYFEDLFARRPFDDAGCRMLADVIGVPAGNLPTRELYERQLRDAGFEQVEFVDRSEVWAPWCAERARGYGEARATHEAIHGAQIVRSMLQFYDVVGQLFGETTGSLGGCVVTGRKPA